MRGQPQVGRLDLLELGNPLVLAAQPAHDGILLEESPEEGDG
jgi:hypothetical protein